MEPTDSQLITNIDRLRYEMQSNLHLSTKLKACANQQFWYDEPNKI